MTTHHPAPAASDQGAFPLAELFRLKKDGAYYRHDAHGYTLDVREAGLFDRNYAMREVQATEGEKVARFRVTAERVPSPDYQPTVSPEQTAAVEWTHKNWHEGARIAGADSAYVAFHAFGAGHVNAHHAAQERIARLQKALAGAQSEAAFIKWVVAEKARPTVLTLHEIRESAIRITKLSTNETA